MILQTNDYNPLAEIIKIVPEEESDLYQSTLDGVRKELFKAGVTCESDEDVIECLKLLSELDVVKLDMNVNRLTFKVKRGPNGQST